MFKEVFAVAAIDPDLAGMGGRRLVEEGLACGGVLDAGRALLVRVTTSSSRLMIMLGGSTWVQARARSMLCASAMWT